MINYLQPILNPNIHIIYFTFNRIYYTKKTHPAILDSSTNEQFQIRIIDNGSTDGTIKYLQNLFYLLGWPLYHKLL